MATGEGCPLILPCSPSFEGNSRTKPIAIDMPHPAPGAPRQVGVKLIALGSMDADLALIRMNVGPVPYVSPVAPLSQQLSDCWSIGFDEMKTPAKQKGAKIVGTETNRFLTDARPFHGRSGGGLIDKKTGYLVGVCSAYTGPHRRQNNPAEDYMRGHNGVYASLPAIHRFLAKAGVMECQLPDIGSPSPFVQPRQPQQQFRPQPFAAPGGL